jgi:CRISPR type IV-associated protein Csf1
MILYTSELAARALHVAPEGTPLQGQSCTCAMCQRKIEPGQLANEMSLPKTFLDFEKIGLSGMVCGWCKATTNQSVMRALQRCVVTQDAVYPLNTDDARAWFWNDPPAPPFAVVINHSTMAAFHYFWRTPVSLDRNFITMNVDNVIYQVNRDRVLKAIEHADALVKASQSLGKKKILKSAFQVISRDPSKSPRASNGRLMATAKALGRTDPELALASSYLEQLTPGELIALSPLLKQNPATPTQPTPITLETAE